MMNRMVGSVLTLVTLLFSAGVAGGQTYTQMQWGMNKATTPYQFGANINGAWSNLGTVSSAGVWSIPSTNISGLGTAAFQNIGTSSATVPLLNGVNTWSGAQTFSAGATIPFTQTGTGAVASTVSDKLNEYISVLDYGADPTGAVASQAAFQAALTANPGKTIYVPKGTYKIEDMITFPTNQGTSLVCDGRLRTVLSVPSTFNMSALGVIRMPFGSSDRIEECAISFYQPNTAVRADVIQYPPAIYAVDQTRFTLRNVRINASYTCLDARGNTGGSLIENLECGALAQSDAIAFGYSGATWPADFVHVNRIECYPFGISSLTTLYSSVYADGTTNCMTIGRVDGFVADTIQAFRTNIKFTTEATGIPYFISNFEFDVDGRLEVESGRVYISNFYATRSSTSANPSILATNANAFVFVSNVDGWVDGGTACNFSATNSGNLAILGGIINHVNLASPAACVSSGGRLEVHDTRVVIPPSNRTAAYFDQTGTNSVMILDGVTSGSAGSATGNAFSYATDNAANKVVGSTFPNWAHGFGFTTSLGYYDLAEPDTCTITPAFDTPGDSVLTVTASSCTYFRKGENINVSSSVTFNTNAYTTAAGSFRMALNTSNQITGSNAVCNFTNVANATITGVQINPFMTNNVVFVRQLVSAAGSNTLGTTNIPASGTGFLFNFGCSYRVR